MVSCSLTVIAIIFMCHRYRKYPVLQPKMLCECLNHFFSRIIFKIRTGIREKSCILPVYLNAHTMNPIWQFLSLLRRIMSYNKEYSIRLMENATNLSGILTGIRGENDRYYCIETILTLSSPIKLLFEEIPYKNLYGAS